MSGRFASRRRARGARGRQGHGDWAGLALAAALGCNPAPLREPPFVLAGASSPPTEVAPALGAAPASTAPTTPQPPAPSAPPPAAAPSLAFLAPAEGELIRASGAAAVSVPVSLDLTGLASVELRAGTSSSTLAAPPWTGALELRSNGKHELQAIGRDASGFEVLRVIRGVEVEGVRGRCQDDLRAHGVAFVPGPETRAIDDPVLLEPVIAGVTFKARGAARPARLLVACALGLRLARLAELAKKHGVDEVLHLGVHNYRPMRNPTCIANDNCKLSQHAYATAIDINGFRVAESGVVYSAERHWIINKTVGVCPGAPQGEGDALLHRMACEMHAQRLFNIILTPNYNALHRDHMHVDLTPASATIRGEDMGVDPVHPELLDE